MQKLLFQLGVTVALAGLFWLAMSQINFVGYFELQKFSTEKEKQLGDVIIKNLSESNKEVRSAELNKIADLIKVRICLANDIDPEELDILIYKNDEVNAFALPGNYIVLYTGLAAFSNSPEELAGVIAHEIAHIKERHVMKKMAKEVGMSMLFTMAGGEATYEIIKQVAQTASSTAFDRDHEREADEKAAVYLANAEIDPEHLANILFRMSQEQPNFPKQLVWLSTHPDSKDRASNILKLRNNLEYTISGITVSDWDSVKTVESDQ